MNISFLSSLTLCFFYLSSFIITEKNISGIVLDSESTPIIGASILVKGTTIGTVTDIEGKFSLTLLDNTSIIECSYLGYNTQEHKVEIGAEKNIRIILKESGDMLDEVIIKGYGDKMMAKSDVAMAMASTSSKAKIGDRSLVIEESFLTTTGFEDSRAPTKFSEDHRKKDFQAGLVTAGEWNDLNNWDDWKELIEKEEYISMQDAWGLYPNDRYSVFVTNDNSFPINNAEVTLWGKNGIKIWTAQSDNSGKAELWNNYNSELDLEIDKITIQKDKNTFTIKDPKSAEEGTNQIKIDLPCQVGGSIDVMFIVDATGSMGDEIAFLKTDLADIINTVEANSEDIEYRTSAVFYRDFKDDYLTEATPFNKNIASTLEFIKLQSAGGGGDYPEAVEEGIAKALAQNWDPNAIAKLAFLILDAPPHENPEVLFKIEQQIKEASERGIKIIPITASGINRKTEFLMKFMAISTNGTYVFITDDSGIGNPHLSPEVPDYEVEKLNALIVRLINNYSIQESCESYKKNTETLLDFKIYPNPATVLVNVELQQAADKIVLRSATGKKLLEVSNPSKGTNKIQLDNFVGGMYSISILKDDQLVGTKRLIKVDN